MAYISDILVVNIILDDIDNNFFVMEGAILLSEVLMVSAVDLSDEYPDVTEVTFKKGDFTYIDCSIGDFISKWKEYKKNSTYLFGVN